MTIPKSNWASPLLFVIRYLFCFFLCRKNPSRPQAHRVPIPLPPTPSSTATSACKGFRSIEGELSLSAAPAVSGCAGHSHRARGRRRRRLEAVAHWRAFFVSPAQRAREPGVAARASRPERHRVAEVPSGYRPHARRRRLRLILSAAWSSKPSRRRPAVVGGWRAVTIAPERVAYLRVQNGQPVLTAADYGPGASIIRALRRLPAHRPRARSGDTALISPRVEQLQVNTAINPLAWVG